jgi:hypothetical protein
LPRVSGAAMAPAQNSRRVGFAHKTHMGSGLKPR